MSLSPETLKEQIREAEEQIAQGERAGRVLPYLQQALQAMEDHGKPAAKKGKAPAQPSAKANSDGNFAPKYGKNAGELGEEILRREGRMPLRKLMDILASEGKSFTDQAVVLGLKKRKSVRRVQAPEHVKAKWEWEVVNGGER